MTFAAFPEADSVRQIPRDVDEAARAEIERRLPFRVHFQELGQHRLYVAFRDHRPIGLLYSRAEETEWGHSDIGWAISLERRIVGFEFAASRSRKADEIASTSFAKHLVGRSFAELCAGFPALARPDAETDPRLHDLVRTVLRSALAATAVVEVVWLPEVEKLADVAMAYEEFPGLVHHRRLIAELAPPAADAPPRELQALRCMLASGRGGFPLGSVARTRIRSGDTGIDLRWVLDARRTIVAIRPVESWPDGDLRQACCTLRGHRLDAAELPATPLTAAAAELAAELALLSGGERRQ
jgi:hypothetical protein